MSLDKIAVFVEIGVPVIGFAGVHHQDRFRRSIGLSGPHVRTDQLRLRALGERDVMFQPFVTQFDHDLASDRNQKLFSSPVSMPASRHAGGHALHNEYAARGEGHVWILERQQRAALFNIIEQVEQSHPAIENALDLDEVRCGGRTFPEEVHTARTFAKSVPRL